jgi:N-hydroxyarylamine O-acetyltransferase
MADGFDLDAYLRRTGAAPPLSADADTLKRLHRAHVQAIPFENLDIQMGLPIEIDAVAVQAALVNRRRGGYCFQQNGLFRLVLNAVGFAPRSRTARVRLDSNGSIRPRTHMTLVVPIAGDDWLADVGFGGSGLVEPIVMGGEPVTQDGWTYRTVRDGALHVLQRAHGAEWEDLYAFSDEDAAPVDFVMGNWFTSTYPESNFIRSLTAQRTVGGTRHILRNLTYMVGANGEWTSREISRSELVPLLREVFGLDVPVDARFRAIDGRL